MSPIKTDFLSIEQATGTFLKAGTKPRVSIEAAESADSFQQILAGKQEEAQGLRFSKHANSRLESRNIVLEETQVERLTEGVSRARDKGINESLVMVDDLAFIVNIKNNTVVTALEQQEKNSVFTNIDGAVIA